MQDNQPTGSTTQAPSPPPNLNATSPAELLELFKFICMKPKEFFPNIMPIEGGFQQPIMFYAIIAGVDSVISAVFQIMNPLGAIMTLIGLFVAIMVGSFVGSAITMAIARMMGGQGNYEATYRACAYATAPQILGFIPLVGLITQLYSIYLLKLALERSHGLTSEKAIMVVAIQVGLAILLALIGFGIAMMIGAAAIFGAHH